MPHRFAARSIKDSWPFDGAPRRIVVKFGSNLLSTPRGTLDEVRVRVLAGQVAGLRERGSQVLIVTSGAVAAGMGVIGEERRPARVPRLQGLAAIGQSRLMSAYIEAFRPYGINVAQMLVTRDDFEDRRRYLNAQYTIETLLGMNAVPILNENDSVITDELTVGDNDMLSAITAATLSADLLVLLTDTDGLYTRPPGHEDAELIPVVERVTPELESIAQGPGSRLGRGGMMSKVTAARHANRFGVIAVIANGRRDGILGEVLSGDFRGTLFLPTGREGVRATARARWISAKRTRGTITVDAGAQRALVEKGRSLLPVGVTAVEGTFAQGDVIAIRNTSREEIGRGISNFSSEEIARIRGAKGSDLAELLGGACSYEEVIHRDNLHLKH